MSFNDEEPPQDPWSSTAHILAIGVIGMMLLAITLDTIKSGKPFRPDGMSALLLTAAVLIILSKVRFR